MRLLRGLWQHLATQVDALWGYDVFIAHRRADAAEYARALFDALTAERVSCFIDQTVYGPGDSLQVATRRHVRKSTIFVLVASPELLIARRPIDWIEVELDEYLSSHLGDPKVVVVDLDRTVERATISGSVEERPLISRLQPFIRLAQESSRLPREPAPDVIAAIHRKLQGRRRDRSRLWFFQAIAVALAGLLGAAIALGIGREWARRSAESRRLIAETRAHLTAPTATQTAVLSARAALAMAETPESRSAVVEVLRMLPSPLAVFDIAEEHSSVMFAAETPAGGLIVHTFTSGTAITVVDRTGHSVVSTLPTGCDELTYSGNGQRAVCQAGRRVQVWETVTPRKVLEEEVSGTAQEQVLAVLNHQGTALAVGDSRSLALFDVEQGTSIRAALPGDGWPPLALAVSPDGRFVAATPSSTTVGDRSPTHVFDSRTHRWRLATQQVATTAFLAFSAPGDRLAIGARNGHVDLYDLTAHAVALQVATLPGLTGLSVSARFIAAGAFGAVAIFDAATGEALARGSTDGPIYHVAFDENSGRLLTAGARGTTLAGRIIVWNVMDSSRFASAAYVPDSGVLTVGFTATAQLLLTTHAGLRVVNPVTGAISDSEVTKYANVEDIVTGDAAVRALFLGQEIGSMTALVRDLDGRSIGPRIDANATAATPDGKAIALLFGTIEAGKSRLHLWRASGGVTSTSAVPVGARLVGIDADGRFVVLSSSRAPGRPSALAVYRATDLQRVAISEDVGRAPVSAMDPRARFVILGNDETLSFRTLPDLENRASVRMLGTIQAIRVSPSGERVAVIDSSGTITVMSGEGAIVLTARAFYEATQRSAIAFSPTDDLVAIVGQVTGKSSMHLLPILTSRFDGELCRRLVEKPTPETWRAILPNDAPPDSCSVVRPMRVTLR